MNQKIIGFVVIAILVVGIGFFLTRGEQFDLPRGETVPLEETEEREESAETNEEEVSDTEPNETVSVNDLAEKPIPAGDGRGLSSRQIFITDGVKHSIPLDEILSGGPPKDGIPSIDDPKFVSASEVDFIDDSAIGLGVVHKGEARFYPYQVLVWHEIVNETIAGDPLLVTYCPLCMTGVVFDRRVDGRAVEFGVSGRLWQSNLLMYDRAGNEDDESLWSQVLGEAVLGTATGDRLEVLPSDTVRFGQWREAHPETLVLTEETGAIRPYGSDPYGDYYTNDFVSFGATFSDDRLSPKEFVLGVELNGQFKAYVANDLPEGTTIDFFAGETITIEKSEIGEVRMSIDGAPIQFIGGFWFSWVAVHPETAVYGE